MTKLYRVVFTGFVSILALVCPQVEAAELSGSELSKWVVNAIQWDSVWGSEATCSDHDVTLSKQLASSKDHIFSTETIRNKDGAVVMLPELHRVVLIRLTPDQQLASLRIETNCETNLANRDTSQTSLHRSSPVQDSRLQKHLEEMKQSSGTRAAQESVATKGTIKIETATKGTATPQQSRRHDEVDALKTIEGAVQRSFEEACVSGEQGVALLPDFELYDPAVLAVIKSNSLTCVLPIGFEHREYSSDPFVAYATHNCVEDLRWVQKVERLISLHPAETKKLTCHTSQNP